MWDVVEIMKKDFGIEILVLKVDGGVVCNDWLM